MHYLHLAYKSLVLSIVMFSLDIAENIIFKDTKNVWWGVFSPF